MSNLKKLTIFTEDNRETELEVFRNTQNRCTIGIIDTDAEMEYPMYVLLSVEGVSALIEELEEIKKQM